jgi:hypothetical protein
VFLLVVLTDKIKSNYTIHHRMPKYRSVARLGKARQGKARQGKARQSKARQGKAHGQGSQTRLAGRAHT